MRTQFDASDHCSSILVSAHESFWTAKRQMDAGDRVDNAVFNAKVGSVDGDYFVAPQRFPLLVQRSKPRES
jgi:hypothetical protein